MAITLGHEQEDIPPFASERTENGVTELAVRAPMSRWLKISLWSMLVLLVCTFIAFVSLVQTHAATQGWPGWPVVLGEVICGIALVVMFLFGFVCVAISAMSGEIIFDGLKLYLKDGMASYEIPLADIQTVRHVGFPGTRLEIDISGPPSRLFFRSRKTAIRIQTTQGRLEFFQIWEEPKVAWLVLNVNRLLFPGEAARAAPITDRIQDETVVIAGRIYGNSRRLLIWGATLVGILATVASGWYTYRGLVSGGWPNTQGVVVQSRYDDSPDSEGRTFYTAEITYTYAVLGKTYTNDDMGFKRDAGDDVVGKLIKDHPAGSPITVYYDPSRAADSIVIPGLGPMQWLLNGISLMPLLIALPFAFRPNTPAQFALSQRYKRRRLKRGEKLGEISPTIRWSMPNDVWRSSIRAARWAVLPMSVRVLGLTGLALWATHRWMGPLCPPDVPWIRIGEILMGFASVSMIAAFCQTIMIGKKPPAYGITAEGILVLSRDHPLIRWKRMVSFIIDADQRQPDLRTLTIHLVEGERRRLTLPGGDLEASIVSEVSSRLPEGPPPPKHAPLTQQDWYRGLTLVALVICGAGTCLSRYAHAFHGKLIVDWIMLIGFVTGPGTWIAIILRRRRSKSQLFVFALTLNLFATLGSLSLATIKYLSQNVS